MKSFELVIFDCDGVLVDSETITNALMIDMLETYGIEYTKQEFVSRFVGVKIEHCIESIIKEYNIKLPDSFLHDYHLKAVELLKLNVQEIAGVRNLIHRLQVPYCVASNSTQSKIEMMLAKTDLLRFFAGKMFSSYDLPNPKPAPDVYLKAASVNKIRPERCAVIEDTPTGIRAGKAAGMTVYGFAGLFPASVLSEAGADDVFDHMDQLFVSGCSS
ncbi:HAD family hydrolase [Methylophilus sp.]|uniref:HAD family hydrolase n=1 Tax=Methylophilus sp. TaxID=29541 RepID=UPI00403709DB